MLNIQACANSVPVCTVPPGPVSIPENNTADIQLVKISSGDDVALRVTVNPEELFYLKGNALMAKKGLDYEVMTCKHKMCASCADIRKLNTYLLLLIHKETHQY